MKKIIAVLSVICISILMLNFFPMNVNACSCAWPESVDHALNDASAVFSGKVIDIKTEKSKDGYYFYVVVFETKRVWKGDKQKEIIVKTYSNCGYSFDVGDEYLVYGYDSSWLVGLETSICTYTKQLTAAEEDLGVLGKGKSPNEIEHYITGSTVLIAIIFICIFYLKRRI